MSVLIWGRLEEEGGLLMVPVAVSTPAPTTRPEEKEEERGGRVR